MTEPEKTSVHISATDKATHSGPGRQLFGVAPNILEAALKHAQRTHRPTKDAQRVKAQRRKTGAAARKARRANRK